MFKRYALLAMIFHPCYAFAQEDRRQARDLSLITYESRLLPELHVKDTPSEMSVHHNQVRVLLPWRRKTEAALLTTTLGFESLRLRYRDWHSTTGPAIANRLYSAQLSFFYRRKLSNKDWSFHSFFTPSLNSDFKSVTTRALGAQAGAMFNRWTLRGTWSFGAVLINDYGSPRVFPAIAYSGNPTARQSLVVRLPVLTSWAYKTSATTETGVAIRVSGNTFLIEEPGAHHHQHLRYSVATVGPTFQWKPSPLIAVRIEAGNTLRHHVDYSDDGTRVARMAFHRSGYALLNTRFFFL